MIFDELWQLRRARNKTIAAFAIDRKAAQSGQERYEIDHSEHFELGMIDDQISAVLTHRLIKEARLLDIPLPVGAWEDSASTGIRYWNTETRLAMTQSIRKERKERRDLHLSLWKDIVLLLTGLTAISSSLLALHKNPESTNKQDRNTMTAPKP